MSPAFLERKTAVTVEAVKAGGHLDVFYLSEQRKSGVNLSTTTESSRKKTETEKARLAT